MNNHAMSGHNGKNYFMNYLFKIFVLWPSYDREPWSIEKRGVICSGF